MVVSSLLGEVCKQQLDDPLLGGFYTESLFGTLPLN